MNLFGRGREKKKHCAISQFFFFDYSQSSDRLEDARQDQRIRKDYGHRE